MADPPPVGDLLYGVAAIADFLGIRKRQAQYLVETGKLPTFRPQGSKIICATRSSLTAWLACRAEASAGGQS